MKQKKKWRCSNNVYDWPPRARLENQRKNRHNKESEWYDKEKTKQANFFFHSCFISRNHQKMYLVNRKKQTQFILISSFLWTNYSTFSDLLHYTHFYSIAILLVGKKEKKRKKSLTHMSHTILTSLLTSHMRIEQKILLHARKKIILRKMKNNYSSCSKVVEN